MSTRQFRLSIGAKRQLTLPAELLEQLRVPERGELLVEVIGDHAVVTPMVSMPRTRLPEELRRTFESRRGADPSDTPLAQFLEEAGYEKKAQKAVAPGRLSLQERLAGLTPNERAALEQAKETVFPQPPERRPIRRTEREEQVLEQVARGLSLRQIARKLGLPEATVKSNLSSIKRKLGKLRATAPDEARSAGS